MIERSRWLERDFAFGLPLSMFPDVLERLRGTPARVEERLEHSPPARLSARPGDSWSIQENVGHLLLVEELWEGRLDDFLAGAEALRPAGYDDSRVDRARFNERPVEELLAAFRVARLRHVGRLAELGPPDAGRMAFHPRLKRTVSVLDMMVFAAEHDDHHLARITQLLGQP
jgi:uncharacterized damage-inducible protein DinB